MASSGILISFLSGILVTQMGYWILRKVENTSTDYGKCDCGRKQERYNHYCPNCGQSDPTGRYSEINS